MRISAIMAFAPFFLPVASAIGGVQLSERSAHFLLEAEARTGGIVDTDAATIPAFTGGASIAAIAEEFIDGERRSRAESVATAVVTGRLREWELDAQLSSDAWVFFGSAAPQSSTALTHALNFRLYAGQELSLTAHFDSDSFVPSGSAAVTSLISTLYRGNERIESRHLLSDGSFTFDVLEETGALYRLRISLTNHAGLFPSTSGARHAFARSDLNLGFSIIPAPISAAPLAFGALLAARRRRA